MNRISRLLFLSLVVLPGLLSLLALAEPHAHSAPRVHWPPPEVDTGHDTGP